MPTMSHNLRDQLLGLASSRRRSPSAPEARKPQAAQARARPARPAAAGKPRPDQAPGPAPRPTRAGPPRQHASASQCHAGAPQRTPGGKPRIARRHRPRQGLRDPRAEGEGRAHRGRAGRSRKKRALRREAKAKLPNCSRTRRSTIRPPRSPATSTTAARSSASMSRGAAQGAQCRRTGRGAAGRPLPAGAAECWPQAEAIFAAGGRAEGRPERAGGGRSVRRSAVPGAGRPGLVSFPAPSSPATAGPICSSRSSGRQ